MQQNIQNRTLFCKDNLKVLQGINSNTIDLIYLDPPFNKKKVFTAPIGSSAKGAEFSDIFTEQDVKQEWIESIKEDNEKLHNFLSGIKNIDGVHSYNFCYLAYMSIRLIECHRILKNTGSIYVHCDPTMSHYLKIALDCIFHAHHFINEIIWHYQTGGAGKRGFSKKHDIVLFYAKSDGYTFNTKDMKIPRTAEVLRRLATGHKNATRATTKTKIANDVFTDIQALNPMSKERTGYPTQKPLALLERIIKASSNENDMVLDPFCGCATTCVAAERLRRQWVGIDIYSKAYELVCKRLNDEVRPGIFKFDPNRDICFSTDAPIRTDDGADYQQQKYVYVLSNIAYPNYYKVGIARNLKQRIISYQTSDPNRGYKQEYHVLTPHYRALEKHIHTVFENNHEWVRADLKSIKNEMHTFLHKSPNA